MGVMASGLLMLMLRLTTATMATAMVLATAMASALLMLMPRLTTAATDTVLVSATLVLTPLAIGPTPPQSTAMPALATAMVLDTAMASAPLMLMLTMAATDMVLVSATLVLTPLA